MASLGMDFNANSVAPATAMEVVPAGKYTAEIVNSEMRDTKDGNGQYLWMELAITEGPQSNRRLFDRLNLVNGNQQAVEIAEKALSAICHATGKMLVSDSEQLHGIPMTITVRVKPAGPDRNGVLREAQNEIRGYEAVSGRIASAPRHQPAAAPQAQASKTSAAPWRK